MEYELHDSSKGEKYIVFLWKQQQVVYFNPEQE